MVYAENLALIVSFGIPNDATIHQLIEPRNDIREICEVII
jgi:hypothetical protein